MQADMMGCQHVQRETRYAIAGHPVLEQIEARDTSRKDAGSMLTVLTCQRVWEV